MTSPLHADYQRFPPPLFSVNFLYVPSFPDQHELRSLRRLRQHRYPLGWKISIQFTVTRFLMNQKSWFMVSQKVLHDDLLFLKIPSSLTANFFTAFFIWPVCISYCERFSLTFFTLKAYKISNEPLQSPVIQSWYFWVTALSKLLWLVCILHFHSDQPHDMSHG